MTLLLTSTLRTSVLLLLAFGATALLRHRSAAWRHWIWSITVAAATAAPLLTLTMPSWHVPIGVASPSQDAPLRAGASVNIESRDPADEVREVQQEPNHAVATPRLAIVVWLIGTGYFFFVLLAGLGRLAWIAARSQRVRTGTWADLAEQISCEQGLRQPPALIETEHPALLVTWGILKPDVILPAAAHAWPPDRVRIVLAHEIAHIARRDWLVQIGADILRCFYWFNPLMWMACRRVRLEAEQAADEAVVNSGIVAVDYATHLVDLARTFVKYRRGWVPAPAIARPSSLERRIRAMLSTTIDRSPMSRRARFTIAAAMAAAGVAIAAAQGPFATFSGSIADPMNGMLANAQLTLTNTQNASKYEVRSDWAGHFEFVGLPPGDYLLEAAFPGFSRLQGTVSVSGQNVQRDLTLKVGSLEETLTVHANHSAPAGVRHEIAHADARRRSADCKPSATGGTLMQPVKLDDVRPQYPQQLENTGVGGLVVLEGVIGTDGTMRDVHVVTPAHPDLDAAAAEAMRQWRFSETLLNCVPVEVPIKATIRFMQ